MGLSLFSRIFAFKKGKIKNKNCQGDMLQLLVYNKYDINYESNKNNSILRESQIIILINYIKKKIQKKKRVTNI